MDIKAIVKCETILGEGPLWDVAEQKIYWIDSYGSKIFRANEDGSDVETWDVPQKIGSLALRRSGGAILSLADGFYLFDFETGKTDLIERVRHKADSVRMNDGKVDQRASLRVRQHRNHRDLCQCGTLQRRHRPQGDADRRRNRRFQRPVLEPGWHDLLFRRQPFAGYLGL